MSNGVDHNIRRNILVVVSRMNNTLNVVFGGVEDSMLNVATPDARGETLEETPIA